MKETILVTGASGLLGSHLVPLALSENYRVISVSNRRSAEQASTPDNVIVDADILDFARIKQIVEEYKPSLVVHLAAQTIVGEALANPQHTFDVNVKGTWNVLQAVKENGGVRRIVVASSDKAYGASDTLPYLEEHPLNAVFPYDTSKQMTEQAAQSYVETYKLPVTITRCANVFGAYDLNFSRLIPGTIKSCLLNEPVIIRSDGTFKRSYVYAKDAALAYMQILKTAEDLSGEVFNIGMEKPFSVLEIVNLILAKFGYGQENIVIQNNAVAEIKDQYLSAKKIETRLGWKPQYEMDAALNETIEWYRQYLGKAQS